MDVSRQCHSASAFTPRLLCDHQSVVERLSEVRNRKIIELSVVSGKVALRHSFSLIDCGLQVERGLCNLFKLLSLVHGTHMSTRKLVLLPPPITNYRSTSVLFALLLGQPHIMLFLVNGCFRAFLRSLRDIGDIWAILSIFFGRGITLSSRSIGVCLLRKSELRYHEVRRHEALISPGTRVYVIFPGNIGPCDTHPSASYTSFNSSAIPSVSGSATRAFWLWPIG